MPSNWPSFSLLLRDLHDDASRRMSTRVLTPSSSAHWFCGANRQTTSPWFWGTNQETVVVILMHKLPNHQPWFWGQNQEIIVVVLRPNHWQIIVTGFEAKPENPHFLSRPHVRRGSHISSPDLLIVRPPSTRLVPDHPWSFAPNLLLLTRSSSLSAMSHSPPTHDETNKRVSPNQITQF
jgi:hypothetical protein